MNPLNLDVYVFEVSAFIDNIPSLLVDVLAIVDLELSTEKKSEEFRKCFLEFLSHLSDRAISGRNIVINLQIVADDVLKCELDILGANEQTTRSRVVKTKTRLFFKQVKFNLLREESEGYAKLITELLDNPSLSVSKALSRLYHLIGQFNLDPNRVIDIILECFESALQRRKFFIDLLTEFKATAFIDNIPSLLVDVLAIVDLELSTEKKSEEFRKCFLEFLSHLSDRASKNITSA
ncbi:hypothetical protein WUBG_16109 [Wuchereria bancrofti]|uniref:THO complex subunit 2 N-terminal domain-containing protein n=1 Tax=Wuchereria bancrofti TaxID=6293 RepID=J9DTK1_WUCBA|nr:hypothetical protein WUBG_16109 [Wuchereria bancrofti]